MTRTLHAEMRMQQRGIQPIIIDWLVGYGATSFDKHGAITYYFDRDARRKLRRDVGRSILTKLSEYLNSYAVFKDEMLITTGPRYKKIRRP